MGTSVAPIQSERLSDGAHALLGLLRPAGESGESTRPLRPHEWDAALGIALRHGVAPLLHRALQDQGTLADAPAPVRLSLEQERRATALDNLGNFGQFRRVARALQDRNIPVIALKGLHLAELVYRDISLRPMSDLDILVPRSSLQEAVATLHGLDYGFEHDVSTAAGAMLDAKCNVGLAHRDTDTWLEVHWSLAEPPQRYAAVIEDIWRNAVPARLGDADARVLSPEFLLLHVCTHLACSHVFVFRLRALCDIAEILQAHPAIDWSLVVDHCRRHGWTRGVAAALRLAGDHLGAAVPADALAALGADALAPEMLAEAMQHLITFIDFPGELAYVVANVNLLAGKRGLAEKLAAMRDRIFVSRAELALSYGVPERSARLPLYYVLRLRDLLRRYAASAWALSVSDPRLAAASARHARLASWIRSG